MVNQQLAGAKFVHNVYAAKVKRMVGERRQISGDISAMEQARRLCPLYFYWTYYAASGRPYTILDWTYSATAGRPYTIVDWTYSAAAGARRAARRAERAVARPPGGRAARALERGE